MLVVRYFGEKRSQCLPYNAKCQARQPLLPFVTLLVWRGQVLNLQPPSSETKALPPELSGPVVLMSKFYHSRPQCSSPDIKSMYHFLLLKFAFFHAQKSSPITYILCNFILDEVERLEKELEAGEQKIKRLEEDHNRSQQERHHLSATEDDLRKREKVKDQRLQEVERELETKNEIVRINLWFL